MVRDAAYIDFRGAQPFALWFLKFFPIGFLVSWDGPQELPYPVQCLDPWRALPYEAMVDLPLRISPLTPEYWPEAPTDHSALAFGAEAINVKVRQ